MRKPGVSVILGVDPGSRKTGYGLLASRKGASHYLASGCIVPALSPMPSRLHEIHSHLLNLIDEYQPDTVVLEQVYVHNNPSTALKLGQVRGVVMLVAMQRGCAFAEYAARFVKKAVVGYGAAEKSQMQAMVQQLLQLPGVPSEDAADALALALCHVQHHVWEQRVGER